ncbi:hypothetical protein SAMD00019534_041220, partial [Acytostelium subglobosum LB1]|uniref:hypothetical protein n=1 Tax=Acytostelium subglobosum LB1 TaxID=1410327 RepID=UPI0006448BE9
MGGVADDGSTYNKKTAMAYIFNLVVGIGALALPAGFQQAGIVLGTLFLAFSGTLAYITTTFIIEAQSAANYLLATEDAGPNEQSVLINGEDEAQSSSSDNEDSPVSPFHTPGINSQFEIVKRTEVGAMTKQFMGNIGCKIFYVVLVIYLYGDLAIYAATVPTSLAKVTGGFTIGSLVLSEHNVYYFYLTIFGCFVGILSNFNFQKTKYLQLATLATRNLAFFLMIILSIIFIASGQGAKAGTLPMFEISKLPQMFGVSIYAFMCHHSLPSIITPIKKKNRTSLMMLADFSSIFVAYVLLCITAVFAFGDVTNPTCTPATTDTFIPCTIQSLYIYNFTSYNIKFFAIFLGLFPVFTLSTNYVLISITLRNNLMNLVTWRAEVFNPKLRSIFFSLLSSLVPILIAFCTRNVGMLVNITGSYAGLGIMFLMPVGLSYFSNRRLTELGVTNPYKSAFSHNAVYIFILVVSVISLGLTTYNNVIKLK